MPDTIDAELDKLLKEYLTACTRQSGTAWEQEEDIAEAKAKITQLLLEEKIKLLARIHCCDNEPEDTEHPLNVCMEEHIELKVQLETALKELSDAKY